MRLVRCLLASLSALLVACGPAALVPLGQPPAVRTSTPIVTVGSTAVPAMTGAPAAATLAATSTAAAITAAATMPQPELTATPAAAGPFYYTVAEGDTLWAIAARYNLAIEVLVDANPGLDPNWLLPGTVLIVPDSTSAPSLAASTTTISVQARVRPDGAGLRLHVEPGLAAEVVAALDAFAPLEMRGRTADGRWLEVATPGGQVGWVAAEWVEIYVALDAVPVSGSVIVTPIARPTLPVAATAGPGLGADPPAALSYRYITGLTPNARAIFERGQAIGNRADIFSKVGDSITLSSVFLNPIGNGDYDLHGYTELQPVIDYYYWGIARGDNNSFASPPLAAKVGWRARAVLSPGAADPAYCDAGEAPLVCEYRLVRPAVALIMLGTNDVPYTPVDEFDADMRRVIELTIDWGIIPVVSTLPPLYRAGLEGRAEQLNEVIVLLAEEYQVPLWDYWTALQPLPNAGMGSDGVHPTWAPVGHSADFTLEYLQYGMTVRNLTALYALDAVWRAAIQP